MLEGSAASIVFQGVQEPRSTRSAACLLQASGNASQRPANISSAWHPWHGSQSCSRTMMQQSLSATQAPLKLTNALDAAGEPSVSELLKKAGLSQHLQAFQGISMENFKTLLMQASCRLPSLAGMDQQLMGRQHAVAAVLQFHCTASVANSQQLVVCCACQCFGATRHTTSWPWHRFLSDGSLKICLLSTGLWQVWGDKHGRQAEAVPPDQAGELPGQACCCRKCNSLAADAKFAFAAKAQGKHSSMFELV